MDARRSILSFIHSHLLTAALLVLTVLTILCEVRCSAPVFYLFDHCGEAGHERFLDQIPASHAAEISALLNRAPEAYRDAFLRYADQFHIEDTKETQCYDASAKIIYIDFSKAADDPRGPYTAFFHECAHAIDDAWKRFPGECFTGSGKGLGKALEADYSGFITGAVREIAAGSRLPQPADAEIRGLILQMRGGTDAAAGWDNHQKLLPEENAASERQEYKNLCKPSDVKCDTLHGETSFDDRSLYFIRKLEERLCPALCDPGAECLSDILGGLSGGHLRGRRLTTDKIQYGYGHDLSYWQIDGNLEKEFFAEYFSYRMTGNQDALRKIAAPSFGVFPQAAAWIDKNISG